MLVVLAVSSALLALTRPTPYLVVLPAFALGVVRAVWTPLLASLGGVVAYGAVAAATHAYGVSEPLRLVSRSSPELAGNTRFPRVPQFAVPVRPLRRR